MYLADIIAMTTEELLPENEVKLLVLKSHLLSLFTSCRSCRCLYTCCEIAHQVETFTSIRIVVTIVATYILYRAAGDLHQ